MRGLKILIVEDELVLATVIQESLLKLGYAITDIARNSKDALLAFRKRIPDLVLCDIVLKGSELDGIEVIHEFNKIEKIPVIFLTAYRDKETVTRAKKLNPAYYLIKPCNILQLQVAIDFAIANFSTNRQADPNHSLQYQAPPSNNVFSNSDFFFVKSGSTFNRLQITDITWVEAMGTYVKIVTNESEFILSANLSSFSKQVNSKTLLRVHRSYILNLKKVTSFKAGTAQVQYQHSQKEIPIGITYRKEFHSFFPKLVSD